MIRADVSAAIRNWQAESHPFEPEIQALIGLATADLYHGPLPVGLCPHCECRRAEDASEGDSWGACDCDPAEHPTTYPGFGPACDVIRAAVDGMPDLYWHDWAGEVSESRPTEWCGACRSFGCDACNNSGSVDCAGADPIGAEDVRRAILGKLAEYL